MIRAIPYYLWAGLALVAVVSGFFEERVDYRLLLSAGPALLFSAYLSMRSARYWRIRAQIESSPYFRDLRAIVEKMNLVGDDLETRRPEIDRFFRLEKSFLDPSLLSGGKLFEKTRRSISIDATGQFRLTLLVKGGAIVRKELFVNNTLDHRRKPVIEGDVEQIGSGNVASRRT